MKSKLLSSIPTNYNEIIQNINEGVVTKLDLSETILQKDEVEKLKIFLEYDQTVVSIRLTKKTFSQINRNEQNIILSSVVIALKNNPNLSELNCAEILLSGEICKEIGELLKKNTTLKKLTLQDLSGYEICYIKEALKENQHLIGLDLSRSHRYSYVSTNDMWSDDTIRSIFFNISKHPTLNKLNLYNIRFENYLDANSSFLQDLGSFPELKTLSLSSFFTLTPTGPIDKQFFKIIFKNLHELDLSNSFFQDNNNINQLIEILPEGLHTLNLSGTDLKSLNTKFPSNIKNLYLNECGINKDSKFFESLPNNVTCLRIAQSIIDKENIYSITDFITRNKDSLEYLDISEGVLDELSALFLALQTTKINTLNFAGTPFASIDNYRLSIIAENIEKMPCLEFIDLNNNNKMMPNELDKAFFNLQNFIKFFSTDMIEKDIMFGIQKLYIAIKKNPSIELVLLEHTDVPQEIVDHINQACIDNRKLVNILNKLLRSNDLQNDLQVLELEERKILLNRKSEAEFYIRSHSEYATLNMDAIVKTFKKELIVEEKEMILESEQHRIVEVEDNNKPQNNIINHSSSESKYEYPKKSSTLYIEEDKADNKDTKKEEKAIETSELAVKQKNMKKWAITALAIGSIFSITGVLTIITKNNLSISEFLKNTFGSFAAKLLQNNKIISIVAGTIGIGSLIGASAAGYRAKQYTNEIKNLNNMDKNIRS